MRIGDFARPETMLRWAGKLGLTILVLLLLPALLQVLLAALPGLSILFGLALLSLVAYAVRESERGRGRRTQQAGGAERIPILPIDTEDL
jgi:hypothetical protein